VIAWSSEAEHFPGTELIAELLGDLHERLVDRAARVGDNQQAAAPAVEVCADRSDHLRLSPARRSANKRDVAPQAAAKRGALGAVEQSVLDYLRSTRRGHIAKKAITGRVRPATGLLDPRDQAAQRQHVVCLEDRPVNAVPEFPREAQRHVQPLNRYDHSRQGRSALNNQLPGSVARDDDRQRGVEDVLDGASETADPPARLQRDRRRRNGSLSRLDLRPQGRAELRAHARQRNHRLIVLGP
jgi:hypothetical protein